MPILGLGTGTGGGNNEKITYASESVFSAHSAMLNQLVSREEDHSEKEADVEGMATAPIDTYSNLR